jgi:hypothetical protein
VVSQGAFDFEMEPFSFRVFRLGKPIKRVDERTRSADLLQLRVCGQWLLRVAEDCISRISKRIFVLSFAHYCRALRLG